MKSIIYFIQFLTIIFLLLIFKFLGLKLGSKLSSKIMKFIGPFFRSKRIINSNILKAYPDLNKEQLNKISQEMWGNYGKILAEYAFIKDFRKSNSSIQIHGQDILDKIKRDNDPVIFISGHFNNFELMAMHIEKVGINLATIYRPLNNKFLNYVMERIRKRYICKNQIKKGRSGTKELLSFFKNNYSIALMIDQRVSQGISSSLFKHDSFTTTIPAQFVKKFNCKVVPIYIERIEDSNFKLTVSDPIKYSKHDSIESITLELNRVLEKFILKNPGQWIWSHNRWK